MKENELIKIKEIDNIDLYKLKKIYKNYVSPSIEKTLSYFDNGEVFFEKANGVYLYTDKNEKILDYTGGLGVLNHGHNHPEIIKARIEFQSQNKLEVNKLNFSKYTGVLSHNIAKLLDDKLTYSFFCNSGAEAVEGAIKTAYKYHKGKRKFLLHSDLSYHGKTIGAGTISNQDDNLFPGLINTDKFIYNDINSLKNKINEHKDNIYAIIIEPLCASAIVALSDQFVTSLRQLCNDNNIILIFDEIYTGWFKSINLFHFLNYKNIYPDILTASKSLGGGKASISVFISNEKIFKKTYGKTSEAFLHSSTYNGFGEECFTAIQALEILINDNYKFKSKRNFDLSLKRINNIKSKFSKYVKDIKVAGGLAGIIFKYNFFTNFIKEDNYLSNKITDITLVKKIITASILNELFSKYKILAYVSEKKFNKSSTKEIILNLNPSIIISENQINYFYDSLEKILNNNIEKIVLKFLLKILSKKI